LNSLHPNTCKKNQKVRLTIRRPQNARGIVLIFALVLLLIISIVSAASLGSSISGEQVSNNLRIRTLAMNASEAAIRYCEDQLLKATTTIVINDFPLDESTGLPVLWQTRSNWQPALANTVPASFINSTDLAAKVQNVLPTCMVERVRIQTVEGGVPRDSYLITSIGYSPDYSKNNAGVVISGGEVWIQLLLRI
jgi:type IV pilus assembly protein PilX